MPYRCATLAPRSRARLLGCFIALLFACGETDRLAEVRELQRGGDYQASLEILRDLAAERPDDAEINYLTGIALIRTQSPALAVWSMRISRSRLSPCCL